MARHRTWLEWLNPLARAQRWVTFLAFVWFVMASALLYRAFTREGIELPALLAIYLLSTVVCSIAALVVYGIDKRRAMRNEPRISERTLHVLGILGGWPGAHFGRRLFRHKTLKLSFRVVFGIIVAAHLAFITYVMVFGWWLDAVRALLGI